MSAWVVFITIVHFSPPLISLPKPKPFDRTRNMIRELEHSAQTLPLTSKELHRLREHADFQKRIVPPGDIERAKGILNEIESFWQELQDISTEPGFRREAFSPRSRLGDWKRRLDALHRSIPAEEIIGSDIHVLPDKLIAVGIDYATNPFLFGDDEHDSVMEEWFVNYYLPMAEESIGGK